LKKQHVRIPEHSPADSHAYRGRVWLYDAAREALYDEVHARIAALLPAGYTYRVEKRETDTPVWKDPANSTGWRASYGHPGDLRWGLHSHPFRTELGALVGLLALLVDGIVQPGCATSYDVMKRASAATGGDIQPTGD